MSPLPESIPPILFFDGVCGLCNGLVDRLLRWDRRGALRFAPLQGETARRMLGADAANLLDTVVLVDSRGTARRSEAILRAFGHLGGAWWLLGALRIVPRPVRDGLYGFVAVRRYRWFSKRDTCRLPAAAERERFLE
jgi:predicted DCC family thiol-disulfide oxidoreductase YuxK